MNFSRSTVCYDAIKFHRIGFKVLSEVSVADSLSERDKGQLYYMRADPGMPEQDKDAMGKVLKAEHWFGYSHSQLNVMASAELAMIELDNMKRKKKRTASFLASVEEVQGNYSKVFRNPVEKLREVSYENCKVVTRFVVSQPTEYTFLWHKKTVVKVEPKISKGPAHTNFRRRENLKKSNIRVATDMKASRMFGLGSAGTSAYIVQQSGGLSSAVRKALARQAKKEARNAREEIQRKACRDRKKKEYKAQPKVVREVLVNAARKARETQKGFDPDVETQGVRGIAVTAAAIAGAAIGVKSSCDKIGDDIKNNILEGIKMVADAAKKLFGQVLWVVPTALFILWLVKKFVPVRPDLAKYLIGGVCCALFTKSTSNWIASISHLFSQEIEQQSVAGPFSKVLASLMAFSIFGQGRGQRQVGEFMKRTTCLGRAADNLESFFEWIVESMKSIVRYVTHAFSGGRISLFEKTQKPFEKWMDKSAKAVSKYKTYSEDGKPEEADELIALLEEGTQYKIVFQGTDVHRQICGILAELHSCLRPYAGSIAARNNRRFEPHMAVFVGDAGIGKTILANYLVPAVLMLSGLCKDAKGPDDIAKHIWQKGTSKYWNGYANQHALVMDDAFQARASLLDEENDYLHIIKAVGTWAFPLNMADLDSKGRIYFNSKFIYATTNVDCIQSEAFKVIHCPEAVVRRFKYAYKLLLEPQYKLEGTHRLDIAKFEEEKAKLEKGGKQGFQAFPWHIWRVAQHNYMTGRTEEKSRPLSELVLEMSRNLKERVSAYESQTADLTDFIKGMQSIDDLTAPQEIQTQSGGVEEDAMSDITLRTVDEVEHYEAANAKLFCSKRVRDVVRQLREEKSRIDFKKITGILLLVPIATVIIKKILEGVVSLFRGFFEKRRALKSDEDLFVPDPPEVVQEIATGTFRGKTLAEWDEFLFSFIDGEVAKRKILDPTITIYSNKDHKVVLVAVDYIDKKGVDQCEILRPPFMRYFGSPSPYQQQSVHGGRATRLRHVITQGADIEHIVPGFRPTVFPLRTDAKDERTVVLDSVYSLVHVHPDGKAIHAGNMMMVNSHLGIMPHHYKVNWKDFDQNIVVQMVNTKNVSLSFSIPFPIFMSLRSYVDPEQDLEFVDFSSLKIRAHRNIKGSFMKEADIERFRGHPVQLDIPVFNRQNVYTSRTEQLGRVQLNGYMNVATPMKRSWKYPQCATVVGDCGAPLTITDMRNVSGRVCMGFHVCWNTRTREGYSAVITQEMIEAAEKRLNNIDDQFLSDIQHQGYAVSLSDDPFPEMGSFKTIGAIDEKYNLPTKTKYFKNEEVFGLFGEYNQLPAQLSPFMKEGELIVPMLNAVRPYSGPVYHYHQKYIGQALHTAMAKFTALSAGDTRMILSTKVAVLGDPMMKLRSIPRNTSPGFPYALKYKDGKKHFFGSDAEYALDSEEFLAVERRVEYILSKAADNVRLAHVFIDFLKDELRPEEKVMLGKTRLISCSPMDYTVAVRRMFGAFTSSFFRHHTKSGMCPGICAYTDWDQLMNVVQEKGQRVFDGDFSGFDTSEQADILERICDFINGWYDDGPINARIRKVLFMELTHSRHLGGTGKNQCFIYQWNRSLPSGHPLTTVVNSIYSLFTLVATYISITGDYTGFWEHVSAVTYGDDNVVNPDDKVSEVYNQVTVSDAMQRELGMVYTSGQKDGKLEPYTDISKITFLQRGFRVEAGEVYSPLKLESFLFTPYWCKNKLLKDGIVIDCMEKSLEELSQHDEELWLKYAPLIIEYLRREAGGTRAEPTRRAYQLLIRTFSDHWY